MNVIVYLPASASQQQDRVISRCSRGRDCSGNLRIGIESTGTYGAGLLCYMQGAAVDVLEVTAPGQA
jgi:hypothetical protein